MEHILGHPNTRMPRSLEEGVRGELHSCEKGRSKSSSRLV